MEVSSAYLEDLILSKKCKDSCQKKTSIGGQALIEGIMMRGPRKTAMAVRDPQGEIVLETWETQSLCKAKIVRLPIIRGVFSFISSMVYGYKALMRSAEIAGLEEVEEELKKEKRAKKEKKRAKSQPSDTDQDTVTDAEGAEQKEKGKKKDGEESSAFMTGLMVVATVLGVALSIGLFIVLPTFIYNWFSPLMPDSIKADPTLNSLVKSVFEGLLKIAILVAYMLLVSLMKDIRRTFQYHGAEHKTIFCYEHGKELTVENVRGERRFHPRCGTSFLILMLLVSIFISFFIDPFFSLIGIPNLHVAVRALVKLLLMPIIMGIGYELIKFAGKHDNIVTRIISAPGVWLQHVTVLEPTDDMIECAIMAFKEVIPEDECDNI